MNTIQSEWELFSKMVIPPGMPSEQVTAMRISFYAGAAAFARLQMVITDDSVTEEAGFNMYAGLMEELSGFVSLVNAGRT